MRPDLYKSVRDALGIRFLVGRRGMGVVSRSYAESQLQLFRTVGTTFTEADEHDMLTALMIGAYALNVGLSREQAIQAMDDSIRRTRP